MSARLSAGTMALRCLRTGHPDRYVTIEERAPDDALLDLLRQFCTSIPRHDHYDDRFRYAGSRLDERRSGDPDRADSNYPRKRT